MDPFNNDWKEAEKKAFEAALAEIDPNSSDWFEQLITRFPNKTPQQLRDHYMDLVVDMECIKSGNFPSPIYSDPWGVDMATETEHLSGLKLPYSPEFSAIESMSSRMGSTSMPEKKAEEEDLSLLPDKGANEETLLEELMRDGFFVPDEWWMKESSHEQVMKQEKPDPEIEGGSEILSPVIAEGDNKGLSLETKGIEIMSPKAVIELQNGKQIVTEGSGVPIGKKAAEKPEISASKKGRLWTKEEHRFDGKN